jgi:hypothetical protein
MIRLFTTYVLFLIFIFGCQTNKEKVIEPPNEPVSNKVNETPKIDVDVQISIEVITAPESTFGYNVLKNGKIYIHQPHIPSISGVKGFSTKEKASRAGELMKYKIQNGIIPPTISSQELDSLELI